MPEREVSPTGTASDGPNVRYLLMDDQRWIVRELDAPAFDRRGGTHLLFESETVMRRLRSFPPNWHQLSDDDLYALTQRIRPK